MTREPFPQSPSEGQAWLSLRLPTHGHLARPTRNPFPHSPSNPPWRSEALCRPAGLTHDGQGGAPGQLLLHGLQHLQPAAVQVAPVDGSVGGADPVQLAGGVVERQAWQWGGGHTEREGVLTVAGGHGSCVCLCWSGVCG